MTWWDVTYLGRDTFIAECTACTWTHTGTAGVVHDEAVKHVRTVHA